MSEEKVKALLTELKSTLLQLEQLASTAIRTGGAASVFLYQLEKELEEKGKGEGK